jgi:hypothetical protein
MLKMDWPPGHRKGGLGLDTPHAGQQPHFRNTLSSLRNIQHMVGSAKYKDKPCEW